MARDPNDINQDEWNRTLADIMNEEPASNLLTVPGVYEAVSEHFNNEIIDRCCAADPEYLYRPLLRPVGYATIPDGVEWEYVEAPPNLTTRPDLPASRHPYGVIKTDRKLTADEKSRFGMADY